MDYETVLKLVEAGFTADDIRGFAGQEPQEPQELQEPQEQQGDGYSSDILDALNKQVEKLTKAIQARNIDLNSTGNAGRETLDDVMAHIINNGMGGTNGR